MEIDKIIYQELHQRRNNKNFQRKLKKLGLLSTYKQEISFFQTMGHLKIPYIVNENLFQAANNNKIILKENMILVINFIILLLGVSLVGHNLFYLPDLSYFVMTTEIIAGLCIIILTFNIMLRARFRQDLYNDAIHTNIVTILDFADCWEKDDINDETLIRLLSDLKATKTALIIAKKSGYMLKDIDLEANEENFALNTWDDESSSASKNNAA